MMLKAHLFQLGPYQTVMLRGNVLDDKFGRLEELVALFAAVLARLFLLDVRRAELSRLPGPVNLCPARVSQL